LSSNLEESISLLPTLFAAVQFGPLEAMIVAAGSMLWDLRPAQEEQEPYKKWAVYTSSRSLNAAATSLAAGALYSLGGDGLGGIAVATFAGAVVAQTLDVGFASLTIKVRGRGRISESVKTIAPVVFAAVPLYAPVVVLLALAYEQLSPWTLLLFFAPGLAAQRFFSLYQDQRLLAEGLEEANRRLELANLSFASALVATLDARDRYTAGHSAAVAIYSRDIARKLGLSDAAQQEVHLAGLVHDIGKIGLPPGLLEKAGPLTLEERRVMQTHSAIGERILNKVDDYEDVALVVRHHHERIDGNGYPDGRSGEDIPLLSRIIAVADAYNAMTSDRPYREAMASQVARMRLAQAVGSQFDVSVVAAFEAVLATADEDYRLGRRADFEYSSDEVDLSVIEIASVA
jgi:putative nucleotidyltransferase with HDIG domain